MNVVGWTKKTSAGAASSATGVKPGGADRSSPLRAGQGGPCAGFGIIGCGRQRPDIERLRWLAQRGDQIPAADCGECDQQEDDDKAEAAQPPPQPPPRRPPARHSRFAIACAGSVRALGLIVRLNVERSTATRPNCLA